MDDQATYEKVRQALELFFSKDHDLLELDVNERSISHKLAEHLQTFFQHYDVDCEYNRRGRIPKRIRGYREQQARMDDSEGQTVYPDIVVHRRNTGVNHLVIEIKKSNSSIDPAWDLKKLRAFTEGDSEYRYDTGLFLVFDVDRGELGDIVCIRAGRVEREGVWSTLKGLGYGE